SAGVARLRAVATGLRFEKPAEAEPGVAAAPRTPPGDSAADRQIRRAESRLQRSPERPDPYAELASAFMNKARETSDGSYYRRAEAAAQKALALDPSSYPALRLVPWIYGGQHRFREARAAAERALALNAQDPFNYGTLGDAL